MKSRILFQTKLHTTQFNYYYKYHNIDPTAERKMPSLVMTVMIRYPACTKPAGSRALDPISKQTPLEDTFNSTLLLLGA